MIFPEILEAPESYSVPIIAGRGWAGLPQPSKILYEERYFQPSEDYELWLDRVTRPYCDSREHRGRMKQYIRNWWFHPSTPVSANAGLPKQGYPVSCFVSHVGDSKEEIIDAWVEGFYLGARGAGIGRYWGDVRSAGEKVGTKGESSGIIPFLKVDEALTLAVSQGGLRRASEAAYLPIWHPEIEEFISLKDPTGDQYRRAPQLFNGVVIDDKFMKAVINKEKYALISPKTKEVLKEVDAFDLWTKLLNMRMQRGVPYILYIDNVNRLRPEEYTKEGWLVSTSQLCVAPETKILTDRGYVTIEEVAGTKQRVWNGTEFSEVEVVCTSPNQKLIKVETTGGDIECTPYHKFYVVRKGGEPKEVRADKLRLGDKLIKFSLPLIEGSETLPFAYDQGFFSGDGCVTKSGSIVYLYNDKQKLISKFAGYSTVYKNSKDPQDRTILRYGNKTLINDKKFVPGAEYTVSSRVKWFEGLLESDGTVISSNKAQSIQIASVDKDFLQSVMLMLQTLGIVSKVTKSKEAGASLFPKNDGSGEYKYYDTQPVFRLIVPTSEVIKLIELGLASEKIDISEINNKYKDARHHYIKVTGIIDEGREAPTYCFTEPKRHLGMFNGLCTGQCSEITLYTSPQYSAICVLGSFNLEFWDEYREDQAVFEQFVKDCHRYQDNVLESFINHAKGEVGFDKVTASGEYERSIGLGTMGWHALLQRKGISFENLQARLLTAQIYNELKTVLDKSKLKNMAL